MLRVSSHRLDIEAGRWARTYKPVHERLYNNCNRLEDEYRFVYQKTKNKKTNKQKKKKKQQQKKQQQLSIVQGRKQKEVLCRSEKKNQVA